jgi:cell division protein FtsA
MSVSKGKNPGKNPGKNSVIAGLDIGSTKVAFVIGIINSEGQLDIAGVGTCPNVGIRQGVVVNIEATTESIRRAKEEAELMSGYQAVEVWVGVSGTHIKSFDSKGMVAIKNKEVTYSDIGRVIEAAKAVAVPADRQVLHVLPREFKVDGQDGITDPIGMSGIRLEAAVHIVTGGQTAINNTTKCIEKAGLHVAGFVLDSLASASAVLSEDEKSLGVCVVDMGGGTCNILYFVNGSVASSSVLPIGGSHFTHDVAVGLRTPQAAAEELKRKYGSALGSLISDTESIDVEGVGGRNSRQIPRKDLADVLEARAEEVLNLIGNDLRLSGLMPMMGSGVVLTGGASQLQGLVEMGEYIFEVPVRRGLPQGVGGLKDVVKTADFSTAVGLLKYGFIERKEAMIQHSQNAQKEFGSLFVSQFGQKVKDFFGDMF